MLLIVYSDLLKIGFGKSTLTTGKCNFFWFVYADVLLLKDADLLEVESKHFEDLEFQQLEHESRLDEEKENLTQQLLREVAEYQRNIVSRKVKD